MTTQSDRVQAVSASPSGTFVPPGYNVLVVVIDDIGPEWFEVYGLGEQYTTDEDFAYARTPFLTSIAQTHGVYFTRANSEPVCSPTRVDINTGRYPNRVGVGFNMRDPTSALGTDYLAFGYATPASETYLAERIRSVKPGVATAAFGKWHMADGYTYQVTTNISLNPPDTNLSHYATLGYQSWKGNIYNVGGGYSWWKLADGAVSSFITPGSYDETTYPTAVHAADAASWLAARTGQFFCYVAFGPPHSSWTVPPFTMLSGETQTELTAAGLTSASSLSDSSGYATANFPLVFRSGMEATDTAIRRIWEAIPFRLRSKTVLIVTGDNGTVANALVPGFVHFKRQLYAGGTHVPFFVRGPMVARPGRAETALCHAVDIYRTTCDLIGVPVPGNIAQDSRSFFSVLKNPGTSHRDYVLVQSFRPIGVTDSSQWLTNSRQRAIYDGTFRYLIPPSGTAEMYRTASDYLEETDIVDDATYADDKDRLSALLLADLPV